ncbi:MAG TPA: nucleoside-diphosphate sugar epimerase/dehydratase [Kofleriaceae bacterium]|nr:nucleoside-diphosphate sugar epimerase/dehydratase [Kofleriaceae bacterium]
MSLYFRRGLQTVLDLSVLSIAYWLAFLIRFEFAIPPAWMAIAWIGWPYVLLVEMAGLIVLRVPRLSWRYVSLRETAAIGIATLLTSGILTVSHALLADTADVFRLPYGVLCSNLFFAFVLLVGIRAGRRIWGETKTRKLRDSEGDLVRVLLIGAGEAGVSVAREIAKRPDLGLVAVGFVDDDMLKLGSSISGLTVLGSTKDIEEIAARKRVTRALITIVNASGADIRRITATCLELGLETKIIPGMHEIVGGHVNLSRIREVAIEDLLGRDPVKLDEQQVTASIRDEVVMVTGAGGSIGSELCRQICRFEPKTLVLVERFENALFEIHRELVEAFPTIAIVPKIADVTDRVRMDAVFAAHRPDCVFHAAAHKHVPMMEENPGEAVKNNVGGTRTVADLAHHHGVERFVLISTDKAVNPTSVMGTTKRVAEIYTQALAQRSKTRFVTVRFGNVLGSNGSVIPIFKAQILRGGPVRVTHPEMQRYFMTIPEASQLVLQAGAMGEGGEIFILDMGSPVKIVDLARDLITLSGFKPDEDIAIEFTGMRPGEKLFEQLATDAEHAEKTKHPKIFIGRITAIPIDEVERDLASLMATADGADAARVRAALFKLVPEFLNGKSEREGRTRRENASDSHPLLVS